MSKELCQFEGFSKRLLQTYASFWCLMMDKIVYTGGILSDFPESEDHLVAGKIQEHIGKDIEFGRLLQFPIRSHTARVHLPCAGNLEA